MSQWRGEPKQPKKLKRLALAAIRTVRVRSNRNLFWFQGPPRNFGDWIGPYIYRARTGQEPIYRWPRNRSLSTVFITVGSLAHIITENCIVWGTGIMWRDSAIRRPHATLAVRGPLTRRRFLELGYPCPDVYGDPAILMPRYYDPRSTCDRPIGMVPHYTHYEEARRIYGEDGDISIIDVCQPVEAVVDAILSCEFIASSSLHGLIIAHSYGRPAAMAAFTGSLGGDGVKFQDYFQAGGIADAPYPLTLSTRVPTQEMHSFIQRSPLPDLASLRSRLLDSCPF